MKNILFVFLLMLSFSCKQEAPENTQETVVAEPVDSTLAELENYFIVEKITEQEFKKIRSETEQYIQQGKEETKYLQEFDSVAERDRDYLIFNANGHKLFFTNVAEEQSSQNMIYQEPVTYAFEGVIRNIAIVHAVYIEAMDYTFVDLASLEKHAMIGCPVVSPDGKKIMAVNADLFAGFTTNGIQFFEKNEKGKWMKKWENEISSFGPDQVWWIDNTTLVMQRELMSGDGEMETTMDYLKLRLK